MTAVYFKSSPALDRSAYSVGDVAAQPLFDGFDTPAPAPDKVPGLSSDQRRTVRQADMIRRGIHPLTGGRLHPLSEIRASRDDAKDLPYRCGSCVFREVIPYRGKSYPKCTWTGSLGADDIERWGLDVLPWVSHSASSDVRAWWPACSNYSAGESSLSRDAARFIPDPSP